MSFLPRSFRPPLHSSFSRLFVSNRGSWQKMISIHVCRRFWRSTLRGSGLKAYWRNTRPVDLYFSLGDSCCAWGYKKYILEDLWWTQFACCCLPLTWSLPEAASQAIRRFDFLTRLASRQMSTRSPSRHRKPGSIGSCSTSFRDIAFRFYDSRLGPKTRKHHIAMVCQQCKKGMTNPYNHYQCVAIKHALRFKMFVFDAWNTAGPISFGQTGSEYFEELCQTFNESVGFMPGLSYFVACPDRDGWVCGAKKLWIPKWQLNFSYKCLYDWNFTEKCELQRGRRSDSLAWVTCHASCGSDPRRAHGHLSHGTLAFDMAHGHVGKPRCDEIWLCFNFYISCSSIVRYSQAVKRQTKVGYSQTSGFNTQILPRIRSRFSSVEHLQTCRACRSTKSTACPLFAVRSSVFGLLG